MQTRTVGYVRVGGGDPKRAQQLLQACEGTLREYARRRGWDVIEIYFDTGDLRAGFRSMLATAHQADVVLIHDEVGPSASDYTLSREVQDMGMTCLDLHAQLDKKKEFVERLTAGRKRGARAGRHTCGSIPYGYIKADDGGLEINREEAGVVRVIFNEYLHLRSTSRVAELLASRDIKTRRGKTFSRASISWLLKNDAYLGYVHYNDISARGQHPAIISPIIFNKVQKLMRSNRKSGKMAVVRPRSSRRMPSIEQRVEGT